MRRHLLLLVAVAGAAAGGTALAQDPDPYVMPEPVVRSGEVLRLASAAGCRTERMLPVRFTPPAGAVFGSFTVRVRGQERARLTGIPRAASATIRLPRDESLVVVTGETLGGQRVRSERVYRICDPEPAPDPDPAPPSSGPPVTVGGGED